jgi:hypothetical protein
LTSRNYFFGPPVLLQPRIFFIAAAPENFDQPKLFFRSPGAAAAENIHPAKQILLLLHPRIFTSQNYFLHFPGAAAAENIHPDFMAAEPENF